MIDIDMRYVKVTPYLATPTILAMYTTKSGYYCSVATQYGTAHAESKSDPDKTFISFLFNESKFDYHLPKFTDAMDILNLVDQFCTEAVTKRFTQYNTRLVENVTESEMSVCILFASGYSKDEISKIRNIATHTVSTHVRNVYSKIKVNSVTQLRDYLYHCGVLKT